MLRSAIVSVVLFVILAEPAQAQRRSKPHKGIPCGNGWISASKTCRIGTPAAAPDTARTSHPGVTSAATLPTAHPLASTVENPPTMTSGDSILHPLLPAGRAWIASIADRVYFHPDCTAAQDIAVANRAMFLAEQAAVNAGYRRSRTPGC